MTIIVMGHLRVPEGQMEVLRPAIARRVAASNGDAGCEHYSFAIDLDDPNLIRISERWESTDALKAHGRAPHMAELTEAVRAAGVSDISVKAWDGHFWRTLIGE